MEDSAHYIITIEIKIIAEMKKLALKMDARLAEMRKMDTEAAKVQKETRYYPVAVMIGDMENLEEIKSLFGTIAHRTDIPQRTGIAPLRKYNHKVNRAVIERDARYTSN